MLVIFDVLVLLDFVSCAQMAALIPKVYDIVLVLRWSSKNEDVLFNVFDVLDLIENALVHFDVLDALVLS